MTGVGSNQFKPQDPYSREQSIITMLRLDRLMNPTEGKPNFPEPEPTEVDAMSLAEISLDYIYSRLKVPSSMDVLYIRHGYYDRSGQSDAILSTRDEYYAVSIMLKAMNSLGGMTTDTYVFLFDLTTGKTYYDLGHVAEDNADYGWGSAKINWLEVETEMIGLGAGAWLNEFTREEVDQIVRQVVEKHTN